MVEVKIDVPAVEKLIEVVASGIGAVAGPVIARLMAGTRAQVRRSDATADADAQRIKAKADAESLVIKTEGQMKAVQHIAEAQENARLPATAEISIDQEIGMRVQFQEQKRQANIHSVVSMAIEELEGKEVPDHDVDHDWTARFFSDVQDVTSEQMQRIWARILSGEVETPGRTSLHTLAILKNMSQRDAEVFANASRFVLGTFILNDSGYTNHLEGFPSLEDLLNLSAYGLLTTSYGLHNTFRFEQRIAGMPAANLMNQRQTAYGVISVVKEQGDAKVPSSCLTLAGQQLYDNIDVETDERYLRCIAKYLQDKTNTRLIRAPVLEKVSSDQIRAGQFVDVLTGQPVVPPVG